MHREAVRLLHARLHRQQLSAERRLLLLCARRRPAVLSLPPGLEPLPLRRVRRPRSYAVRMSPKPYSLSEIISKGGPLSRRR